MVLQLVNVGAANNDGTGDTIRAALTKVNANATELYSKLPGTFNVRTYGALGNSNGTTGNGADDTTAINAAITAASLAGGEVYFPPGIYRSTVAAITIAASGVHVRGAGPGASQLYFDSSDITTFGRLIFDGGASSGTINQVSCQSLTVFNNPGVAVAGFHPGYPGNACLITFRGCKHFVLNNTECFQSANYGISILRSADGWISGNESYNHTADGIHVQDGCTRIRIVGNSIHDQADDGIGVGYYGAACSSIDIMGNDFYNTGGGISIYGCPTTGVKIIGNSIDTTWIGAIKLAAASNTGGASNAISNVVISGNTVNNAGMKSTALPDRGIGPVQAAICSAPSGGLIKDVVITDNVLTNSRGGHIWAIADATGSTSNIIISNNMCDGILAVGGQGAAASGGGSANNTADGNYPGIMIRSTNQAQVIGNYIGSAFDTGLLADSGNSGVIRVSDNTFNNISFGGAGGKYGITITSGVPVVTNNTMGASGNTLGIKNLTSALIDTNNVMVPTALLAADNFTRANVAPAVGALGNTSTGGFAWTGSAAGIASNQANFASASNPAVVISCGASDVDISITAVQSGTSVRLVARGTSAASSGAAVILESASSRLFYYDGAAIHYIGSPTAGTAVTSGTHVYRLVVKGNTATAYIDGVVVQTGTYSAGLPVTNYVGFQESSGTTVSALFSNFSVSAAA